METNPTYRDLTRCRVCGSKDLVRFLDLGQMPLVNRYLDSTDTAHAEPHFPLQILFCGDCFLSQLSVVVAPEILYCKYAYHSSVSRTFQAHCEAMANALARGFELTEKDLVVEIASNDGCLLSRFQKLGCKTLGVEPAENLAALAESQGLPTLNQFWSAQVSDQIIEHHGQAKLVIATNVLAHVDDLHGFIRAVVPLLKSSGAFVFEVPYMVNFMNRAEFDTAYHEHLSYFLLHPLKRALEQNGLRIADVQEFEIHGGSIRVTARRAADGPDSAPSARTMADGPARTPLGGPNVQRLLQWEEELGLHEQATYLHFAAHVERLKEELTSFVHALKSRGRSLAAYGASAKGNVLLNYCGLGKETLDYVVDDTPSKQGKFYPGNRLPIVSRAHLREAPPDYLLLLAWNFVDELVQNTTDFRARGGRYIVPIPSLRVI